MTFSAVCILTEFVESSYLGRPRSGKPPRWDWKPVPVRRIVPPPPPPPVRPVYKVNPCVIRLMLCPECGVICEVREGLETRRVHPGRTHCRRKVTMDLSKHIEWVYPRTEGDLTVYAESAEDAMRCLSEDHGFKNLDPTKIKPRGKRLTSAIDSGTASDVENEKALLVKMGKL